MLNTFDFKTRTHDLNVTFIKYSRRWNGRQRH
jgi:hypothetical protein